MILQQQDSHAAFIGLGSNLDNPAEQIRSALVALGEIVSCRLVRSSSLYRSTPWGYADQPDFVNAVAHVETELTPRALLQALLAIEQARGRQRGIANGPRILDLDLLLYGQARIHEPDLVVPHPRMHERAFVLVPLLEIHPQAVIPGCGSVAQLLAGIDTQGVEPIGHA